MSKITGKVNYKEVLKGDTGYMFEPHVTVDGVLYWTNNGNLENPLPVNIKGKSGDIVQEEEINNLYNMSLEYKNISMSKCDNTGNDNVSILFNNDNGYIINDGVYKVNNEIINKLNKNNFLGNGKLKNANCENGYVDTNKYNEWSSNEYIIDRTLINDNIYKDMIILSDWLPNRQISVKNGFASHKLKSGNGNFRPIGAIYKVGNGLGTVTLCISKLKMYGLKKDGKWNILTEDGKDIQAYKYQIPWLPEVGEKINESKIKRFNNHIEISLNDADFMPTQIGKTESVIHFWGNSFKFENINDWLAIIVSCEFWIKEKTDKKLIIDNGFDIYDSENNIRQGVLSRNKYISNKKETLWSHTMDYNQYISYMDYELIKFYENKDILKDVIYPNVNKIEPNQTINSNLLIENHNNNVYTTDDIDNISNLIPLNETKKINIPYNNEILNGYIPFIKIKKTGGITLNVQVITQYGSYNNFIIFIDNNVKFNNLNSVNKIEKILIAEILENETIIYCKVPRFTQMCIIVNTIYANDIYEYNKISYDKDLFKIFNPTTKYLDKIIDYTEIKNNKVESE